MGLMTAAFSVLVGCTSIATTVDEATTDAQRLVSAATWLEGSFSSAEQAARDDRFFEVVLHHARIWPEREDGYWFYVEQAIAAAADRPYRQRVYRVWLRPDRAVESAVYEMPDPESRAGTWDSPESFDDLSPLNLTKREGCEVVFTDFASNRMRGETAVGTCASTLRGAAYATSEVTLTPDQIRSWDRGWDADGEYVWGAEDGPYVFDRIRR
ncbi:MAG: chromophore lyase CpcT/CpeT [Planctomycetota bacterium]